MMKMTIDDKEMAVIPYEAFLSLRALARQVSEGVALQNDMKTVPVIVHQDHVKLAKRALKRLGK